MALISSAAAPVFDKAVIKQRDFIRAQYHTWPEPRNGLVVSVTDSTIQAIFLPGVHAATRYYEIRAQEVADGKWSVMYSRDLATIGKESMAGAYAKEGGEASGDGK